jgi:serine protease
MKHLKDKNLKNKHKLFFRHSIKTVALFIAIASVSITESFAANDSLSATDVQSKFIHASADRAIKDQYIVVLKSDYIDEQISTTFGQATINAASTMDTMNYRRYAVENTVTAMANSHNVAVKTQYHAALSGFTAQMTETDMRALLADDRVAFIEQDQIMRANITQSNATFGLDRIDQANLPLDSFYNYDTDGSDVRAYVIDTGILVSHSDFGGRAENGRDLVDNDNIANDCNGHGTHVAGTIGSSTFGVAKNVTLIGVRVLGCDGSGLNSVVIAGVDWVTQNAVRPAVANMSLGGGSSAALDASVQNAINSGITFVVAAGNSNTDACVGSPNRVPDALTVASSTSTDARSSFSNWGTCIDLFAPGSGITSTWNDGGNVTISGTSMAAPHVAGVVALYLQDNTSASPATVNAAIVNNASSGKITDTSGSQNLLLQSRFNGSTPPGNNDNILEKAVPKTGLFGDRPGTEIVYTMEVPVGATDLNFNISGNGDADLYVKSGSAPTTSSYDCRPFLNGSIENCNFANPDTGTYFIMLRAFSTFSGASLVGDYTVSNGDGGGDGNELFFENLVKTNIPNDLNGFPPSVNSAIFVNQTGSTSTVQATLDIKHDNPENLIIEIVYPDGTRTTLETLTAETRTYTLDFPSRTVGVWQLVVRDRGRNGKTGFIDSWSLTFK